MLKIFFLTLSAALLFSGSGAWASKDCRDTLAITKDHPQGWLQVTVGEIVEGLANNRVAFHSGTAIQTASKLLSLALVPNCQVVGAEVSKVDDSYFVELKFPVECGVGSVKYNIDGIKDSFPYLPY